VDVIATFVPSSQASELMEPTDRPLHDPAMLTKTAAMVRISFRQDRLDAASPQLPAMRLGVVGPIALDSIGALPWAAAPAADGRDGLHQRQKLGHVVDVGAGQRAG
jgi:hypothetical protein